MKTTSRREFLKGTLAGAASLTLAGVLSACGADSKPTPAADLTPTAGKGTYIPGTYKATAQGYDSEVTVSMTFDAESITDVQIDVSGETPDLGGKIGDKIGRASCRERV